MAEKNPQVILPDRYMFVARSLILLVKENRVLLQKAAPTKKIWAGFYNGFGGHIENGEDVLASAKRELMEEAGIDCPDLYLCGIVTIEVNEKQGIMMFVFSGTEISGTLTGSSEGKPEWIDIDKVKDLTVVEDVPFLVEMILKEKRLFIGHYSYDGSGKLITGFDFQPD